MTEHPLSAEVVRLFNETGQARAIARQLRLTPGQVAGIVYRARKAGLITRPKEERPFLKKGEADVRPQRPPAI